MPTNPEFMARMFQQHGQRRDRRLNAATAQIERELNREVQQTQSVQQEAFDTTRPVRQKRQLFDFINEAFETGDPKLIANAQKQLSQLLKMQERSAEPGFQARMAKFREAQESGPQIEGPDENQRTTIDFRDPSERFPEVSDPRFQDLPGRITDARAALESAQAPGGGGGSSCGWRWWLWSVLCCRPWQDECSWNGCTWDYASSDSSKQVATDQRASPANKLWGGCTGWRSRSRRKPYVNSGKISR